VVLPPDVFAGVVKAMWLVPVHMLVVCSTESRPGVPAGSGGCFSSSN
jgi:hypothetical protein